MKLPSQNKALIPILVLMIGFSRCGTGPAKVAPAIAATPEGTTITLQDSLAEARGVPLGNMFGINGYEWNFQENPAAPNERGHIYEDNMALIKCFSALRHYMNWNKLENTQGDYTFNPTNNGSWDYDLIYTRCKQDSILVLADMKNLPVWMMDTYPTDQRDDENIPVSYGADLSKPSSYVIQARTAFQFTARYGANTAVDPKLVKVDTRPRWANDKPNQVKIGLGLIKYIECGNENDRWWKGDKATQTPEQYAANLSAFYDGHKGTLGNNAGVKTADPNMQVVMTGLATADVNYVKRMVAWCKTNRGYKPDGSINLCFDIINYHLYANDGSVFTHTKATTGIAPELSDASRVADSFVKYADSLPGKPEVWVTETGYDINPGSYQRAPAIGNKSALLTQADWILRSSLLYARHGVKRLFFYQLFDAFPDKEEQYATSGLAQSPKRRPAADYILQATKLMGNYRYAGMVGQNPIIDKYKSGTNNVIYALTIPEQTGRTANYVLDLGKAIKTAVLYTPKAGGGEMTKTTLTLTNGKVKVPLSETPSFLQVGL